MPLSNKRISSFIFYCGVTVILLAFIVLIGWQFDIGLFKSILPSLTPMNPVTAFTFILCGLWLIFFNKQQHFFLNVLSICIIIVGFIHFVTYIFPLDTVRMDHLFFGNKIRKLEALNLANTPTAPLIAPNTALCFLLVGINMLHVNLNNKKWQLVRQALIITTFLLVYASLLGYLYSIRPAYRFGGYAPMALVTTFTFLFVVMPLLLTNIKYGISATFASPLYGGRLMRRIIPFILVFPPITGYLRLLGEQEGLYPTEFGVELNTFIFTIALLIFVGFYAILGNRKQSQELQAELLRKETEQRSKLLMNALSEGVMEVNPNGYVVFCNPACEHILGYTLDELKSKTAIEIMVPQSDREIFERRKEQRKSGVEEEYKSQMLTKQGNRIWVSIVSRPLMSISNEHTGTLVTIRDITEETNNLQDLQAFTSSAAHDLSSPLSTMIMIANVLGTRELNAEQQSLLADIQAIAGNMHKLMMDLLQFSRMSSAAMEKTNIDTMTLVRDVCEEFEMVNRKCTINIEPLENIVANPVATRQLFTNLISNAIKYSSATENPKVDINCYHKNNQTWFSIKDNGIGMKPDSVAQLFTPFKRFTGKFEGNGLGLAIVKRITERHGGHIVAQVNNNQEGNGLTFHLTLDTELPL